jgi:hypothetical protein
MATILTFVPNLLFGVQVANAVRAAGGEAWVCAGPAAFQTALNETVRVTANSAMAQELPKWLARQLAPTGPAAPDHRSDNDRDEPDAIIEPED